MKQTVTTTHLKKRIIVGISGASGIIYGIRLLEILTNTDIETHLIISESAKLTNQYETTLKVDEISKLADKVYSNKDLSAATSSGSFKTLGMIIAPCSMRTLSCIVSGIAHNLLTRSADVILKERRRLVLMVRESPLHKGHIQNMLAITEMGGIIAPPVPSFYNHPETIDDMVTYTICRVLDLFDIEIEGIKRWGGQP